mmetsp:Transcript_14234/g.36932  ORF Transcript_14234/g.36932 Transcript_14234/m.36932 type:complete len:374 (-) Transcript_14234:106-1227(-)
MTTHAEWDVWKQLAHWEARDTEHRMDARLLGEALKRLGLLTPDQDTSKLTDGAWWAVRAAHDARWGYTLSVDEYGSFVAQARTRYINFIRDEQKWLELAPVLAAVTESVTEASAGRVLQEEWDATMDSFRALPQPKKTGLELELEYLEQELVHYHQQKPGLKPGPPLPRPPNRRSARATKPAAPVDPMAGSLEGLNKIQRLRARLKPEVIKQMLLGLKANLNKEALQAELQRLKAKYADTIKSRAKEELARLKAKVDVHNLKAQLVSRAKQLSLRGIRAVISRVHRRVNVVAPSPSTCGEGSISTTDGLSPQSSASLSALTPDLSSGNNLAEANRLAEGAGWRPSLRVDVQTIEWRPHSMHIAGGRAACSGIA